jgi:hypothetical protein
VTTGLGTQNTTWYSRLLPLLLKPFFKTPLQGAQTSLYVARDLKLKNVSGKYFSSSRLCKPKPWALDDAAAEKLWAISVEMTAL